MKTTTAPSKIETPVTGGCSCGAIRYQSNENPEFQIICQCTQCQKLTGTGHAPLVAFQSDNFVISGELKFFDTISDDGNTVSHGFCPTCGNPILNKPAIAPDKIFVLVGSLDNPANFRPEFVVYSNSGHAWDTVDPELKKY